MEKEERKDKEKTRLKSFELLRLWKEISQEEGETWQLSKEMRELEKAKKLEKRERLAKAGRKKDKTLEKIRKKEIQTTISITKRLAEKPEKGKKIVEARL